MASRAAKRILQEAAPHVGSEVIVIAPGIEGQGYFASSVPVGSAKHIEFHIALVNEALKRLKQWHRRRLQEESNMASKAGKGATATTIKLGANMKKVKEKKVPFQKDFGATNKSVKGAMKGSKK